MVKPQMLVSVVQEIVWAHQARGYKNISMLNSTEHNILIAHENYRTLKKIDISCF